MADDERLSPEELRRIYEQRIAPRHRARMVAQEQPIAFFIGGQPGAGKSHARANIAQGLHGQAVIVDTDKLREFDPRYQQLERTDPQRAMELGGPSASAWTIMLRNDVIAARAHVIYETVMRDPKAFAWIIDKMAQTHRVELDVVATRPEVATGRVLLRREDTITEYGSARVVPPEVIRSAESGMLDSLRQAEARGQISRIHIRDQDGKTLYEAQAPYPPGGQAAAIIERDRQRPLSARENEVLREDWTKTLNQMAARRIDPQERRELVNFGPLPATVKDAIIGGSLALTPISRNLASQILADVERITSQIQPIGQTTATAAPSTEAPTNQAPTVRFHERDCTVVVDPPRGSAAPTFRLHDVQTGKEVTKITTTAAQRDPAPGCIHVQNHGEQAGLADALAKSGAFERGRDLLGGMVVEMKVKDPTLQPHVERHEQAQAQAKEAKPAKEMRRKGPTLERD